MRRAEFMKELEYLLQDIPDEEKEEALAYYRDYLEDAGDENEEQVIREFGSPERVAAIIRSDLDGNLENGGEFTESGYQDERFREPNYQVAKRMDLPEKSAWQQEGTHWQEGSSRQENRGYSENWKQQDFRDRMWLKRLLKVGLLLVILGVLAPILLGAGGTVLGILLAAALLLAGAVVLIGVLTVTACLGAVALLVWGAGLMFTEPGTGMMVLGAGVGALGLGLIGIVLSVLIYGKFLPWCIRGLVNGISSLIHRGKWCGQKG